MFQSHIEPGTFHDNRQLWATHWDEKTETVKPETITDIAIEEHERYPNKRHIVHYLQPHYPFIGECGTKVTSETTYKPGGKGTEYRNVWSRLEAGEVSPSAIWDAYRENLELTLPHVERLIDAVDGKVVVTADHGNELGRFGIYGHPPKFYLESLVRVPWLEIPFETRRNITEGSRSEARPDEDTEEYLQALGYV